jgi:hypothetical protein
VPNVVYASELPLQFSPTLFIVNIPTFIGGTVIFGNKWINYKIIKQQRGTIDFITLYLLGQL